MLDAIAPCGWWGQHNKTAAHKTMFSSCMAQRPTVLDKIDGKFVPPSLPPPPPSIKDGKLARFGFCAASSLIWGGWGFAVPFYSVQECRCSQPRREDGHDVVHV